MPFRIIVTIFLFALCFACTQPDSLSRTGEAHLVESSNFDDYCHELIRHLEAANEMVSRLERFRWAEFTDLVVVLPPPDVCAAKASYLAEKDSVGHNLNWLPFTQQLSFSHVAKNFAVSCGNCLSLAYQVCSTGACSSLVERQELCYRLNSALTGAYHLVLTQKSVVENQVIPEIEQQFNRSDEKTKAKYLGKFRLKCSDYFTLLDGLLYHLEQSQEIASRFKGS